MGWDSYSKYEGEKYETAMDNGKFPERRLSWMFSLL